MFEGTFLTYVVVLIFLLISIAMLFNLTPCSCKVISHRYSQELMTVVEISPQHLHVVEMFLDKKQCLAILIGLEIPFFFFNFFFQLEYSLQPPYKVYLCSDFRLHIGYMQSTGFLFQLMITFIPDYKTQFIAVSTVSF